MARARSGKSKRQFIIESIEPRLLLSKTIYVDVNATGATHDGTSWTNAFVDLQQGLAAAVSGDEIHVADGTYKPTSGTDRTISFALKFGVKIYGGYFGDGAPNPNARDIAANVTSLSGDIGNVGSSSDNSYHVVTATGVGTATVMDGFTVTLGRATGTASNQNIGAGLLALASSSPILSNCKFSGNAASLGGGIYSNASSPVLTNCTFNGNTGSNFGGGIYNNNSRPSLSNCSFTGNAASSGGGIYNYNSSSQTLDHCSFNGNTAAVGGGIHSTNYSSTILSNCALSGNTASTSGGGIYNLDSALVLAGCTLSGNIASSSGGAVLSASSPSNSSSLNLTNCIVWGSGASPITSSSSTVVYSDIQGSYSGIGNVNVEPRFVRSPWPGPDGVFGTGDDDYGDLRLRSGSACLDSGSNSAIRGVTDLAGNPRIQNSSVDLGAYEGGFVAPASKLIYVDQGSLGSNDGTSWTNAYTSLQSAILAASDGDTIRIANGTYRTTNGTDRKISFSLKYGMSLYGGYAGDGASDPDARDISAYATILSGDIGAGGTTDDNSYHVVDVTECAGGAVMDGLILALGNASGGGTNQANGGGLLATGSSSLVVSNCTFVGNRATYGGGGYSSYSSLIFVNCTFSGNTASYGGGVYNSNSTLTLTDCTFSANTGSGMSNASSAAMLTNCTFSGNTGGGMANSFSSPILTNCSFSGNTGSGGMSNNGSSPILANCTFSGNTASQGGGIYNSSSSPALTNCAFIGNIAFSTGGGGMYNYFSSPSLTNCTFVRNSGSSGGGIYDIYSSPILTNCSFGGNHSQSGGGMYNRGSSPILTSCSFTGNNAYSSSGNSEFSQGSGMYNSETSSPILTNCTFVANQAFSDGGAIYNYSSSSPILSNCIVWGSGRNPVYDASSTSTVMYSDIQGGYNGIGNSNVEPQFVRSPWVGQDGYFATADDDYGDLRLRIGSGCLDAGSNAAVPANATDIAGNTRIQNQTVDLGAYEGAFAAPASKLIYVDQRSNGANTGASWADAYTSLQSAILAASDGDVIRVADGTYMPTDGTDRMIRFSLRSGVNLYGGYAGYGAPFPDARDIEANATLLSGDIGTVGTVADNSYHVVTATQFAAPAVIDGLSITLGYANEALDRGHGGGFLAIGILSVTLNNCTFIANTASYGGGMYNSYSSPVLTNCTFRLNEGVGMYNSNSSPTLTDCSFSGNTGTYGGMCNDNSSPMLDNCSFSGNIAESCGGAMSNVHSSSPTLTECTFNGNSAALYGGGIYNYSCSPTLTNCIFSGNAATSNGGGMYNSSASPALTNCIFSGNSASSYGGGIYNSSSAPTLINCTLNGNTATSRGGALANESTSSPTLTNCIVWSNGSGGIYNSSSTPIITYCDIQGGYSGNGNMNVDPRFIASPGDLRLQVTSPCIDAGSNSAVPAGVITDAAGNSRIVDYPAVHDPGAIVDMGAYERPASLTATGGGVIADGPQPGVRFDMSSQLDVASIALGDVLIRTVLGDGSLGPTVNATGFSYDSTTRGIRFNLPVSIVDGNYRASLLIGSVSDTYGNALAAECSQDFFILGGDANRDRVVDINDLAILAMNWQGSGKVFSQGDFNYDGKVDAKDLGILSTHWQQALPPPAAAAPVSVVRAPTRTATRVIALVAPSL